MTTIIFKKMIFFFFQFITEWSDTNCNERTEIKYRRDVYNIFFFISAYL